MLNCWPSHLTAHKIQLDRNVLNSFKGLCTLSTGCIGSTIHAHSAEVRHLPRAGYRKSVAKAWKRSVSAILADIQIKQATEKEEEKRKVAQGQEKDLENKGKEKWNESVLWGLPCVLWRFCLVRPGGEMGEMCFLWGVNCALRGMNITFVMPVTISKTFHKNKDRCYHWYESLVTNETGLRKRCVWVSKAKGLSVSEWLTELSGLGTILL